MKLEDERKISRLRDLEQREEKEKEVSTEPGGGNSGNRVHLKRVWQSKAFPEE